jgi:hypothetical protein
MRENSEEESQSFLLRNNVKPSPFVGADFKLRPIVFIPLYK